LCRGRSGGSARRAVLGFPLSASQDREHGSPLERWRAFDDGDIGDTRGNPRDLIAGDLRVGGFPPAEAHLDFDFVTLLEEATRGSHADLQVVVVCAWSKADLLHLRDVLVLL